MNCGPIDCTDIIASNETLILFHFRVVLQAN